MPEVDVKHATTRLMDIVPPEPQKTENAASSDESIEERILCAALICLEGHFTQSPPMGPATTARVNSMISKTLEKTHTFRKARFVTPRLRFSFLPTSLTVDSREALSTNVAVWIWLTRILAAAIPSLTTRSIGPLSSLNDPDKGVSPQESTALIVLNHVTIKEDLGTLIKLMHIARNLLVNAEPEVPQDICAAVHFDKMVYQTIILCVNVTSKGYDGDILDENQRLKLADVTELFKKLLVTSLQQAHNWTAKNDRNKMSFWFDVLFDDEGVLSATDDEMDDEAGFHPEVAKQQVHHWLDRNSRMCDTARKLLRDYAENQADKPPGELPPVRPLAWNWLPEGSVEAPDDGDQNGDKITPVWDANATDKFAQDRTYGRVSREIDTWWLRARDPNYDEWVVGMPSVEIAKSRTQHCRDNLTNRYTHTYRPEHSPRTVDEDEVSEVGHCPECHGCYHGSQDGEHSHDEHDHDHEHHEHTCGHDHHDDEDHEYVCNHEHHHHDHDHDHDYAHDYVDDMIDDDDVDDEGSYADGPLSGLLTEVPNILDPKQIEALHMIMKSCILDGAGSGLTRAGENLQKTRCRMLLATDCGRSLLREMLVFIAVWEKDELSLIFQVTAQIIEALHINALIPYAWNSLRIHKDIISPAQTVLLRLVTHMYRVRLKSTTTPADHRYDPREFKLVHFLYSFFRSRIVPECVALMHLQAQIREDKLSAQEFPVDTWDMERAKDGLSQYLEFIAAVAESLEMREKLIEWEAVYDLITILNGLEAGVEKKPLIELPKRGPDGSRDSESRSPSPPPPPMQDQPHKFPWSGIKGQIFTIIATLLQPPPGQSSPGNSQVQMQMVRHNGIVPLLNCCAYDDHNPFAKERVTICLKWLLDGCEAANTFFKELVRMSPPPNLKPPAGGAATGTLRVDGIQGDVKVQVRSSTDRPGPNQGQTLPGIDELTRGMENLNNERPPSDDKPDPSRLEEDFMA